MEPKNFQWVVYKDCDLVTIESQNLIRIESVEDLKRYQEQNFRFVTFCVGTLITIVMAPEDKSMHRYLFESQSAEFKESDIVDAGFVKFKLESSMLPTGESQKYPQHIISDNYNRDFTILALENLQIEVNKNGSLD